MIGLPQSQTGSSDATSPINFRIATIRNDLRGAFELVYQQYLVTGLTVPNAEQMRITPYHLLPTTEVLIASTIDEVLCTATIVRDGSLGLPIDSVYANEARQLRESGQVLAEVSCLADRRKHQTQGFPVVGRLMSLIAQTSKLRGVDQLLIAVHPRHGRFYRRYLGFRQIGDETTYPSVRNRPAVALSLDLNHLEQHSPEGYERLFGDLFPESAIRYAPIPPDFLEEMEQIVLSAQGNRFQRHLPQIGLISA